MPVFSTDIGIATYHGGADGLVIAISPTGAEEWAHSTVVAKIHDGSMPTIETDVPSLLTHFTAPSSCKDLWFVYTVNYVPDTEPEITSRVSINLQIHCSYLALQIISFLLWLSFLSQ